MPRFRRLWPDEVRDARAVFEASIPYDNIVISDIGSGGAVTLSGRGLRDSTFVYTICWGDTVFENGVRGAQKLSTFIHELTHVWQGNNGIYPTVYMAQSTVAQVGHGLADIFGQRQWQGWDTHRGKAYEFAAGDIGKDWSAFNVEQQGNLVQSWFIAETDRQREGWDFGSGVTGGGASTDDPRFPYIRDVIRGRDRHAAYRAPVQAARGSQAPVAGTDASIKRIQDRLVELGYLHPRHADGTVGRTRSATLDAVEAFQRRNGLRPDRNLGGPNSDTRRKLALPAARLVRAA